MSDAAATILEQCFIALKLAPPSSFDDDTPQANDARSLYPVARDMVLESVDWSEASVTASLPEAELPAGFATDPVLPYTYALPGQCLKLRDVDRARAPRWRLDRGGILRADVPGPLPIRYTERIDNELLLGAALRTAIALQLAIMLAPRWLGTASERQQLREELTLAMQQARRTDRDNASPGYLDGREDRSNDWIAEARQ